MGQMIMDLMVFEGERKDLFGLIRSYLMAFPSLMEIVVDDLFGLFTEAWSEAHVALHCAIDDATWDEGEYPGSWCFMNGAVTLIPWVGDRVMKLIKTGDDTYRLVFNFKMRPSASIAGDIIGAYYENGLDRKVNLLEERGYRLDMNNGQATIVRYVNGRFNYHKTEVVVK